MSKEIGDASICELEKLAALKDKGILTQQEFDLKKQQILGLNVAGQTPESKNEKPMPPASYSTTWGFFFTSGPGYWKAKPAYWIGWVCALVMCLLIWPIGIGMFAFLFVASLISRGDWRKNELQKAIADAASK